MSFWISKAKHPTDKIKAEEKMKKKKCVCETSV